MPTVEPFTPEQVVTMGNNGLHVAARTMWRAAQGLDPVIESANNAIRDKKRSIQHHTMSAVLITIGFGALLGGIVLLAASPAIKINTIPLMLMLSAVFVASILLEVVSDKLEERYANFSKHGFGHDYAELLTLIGLTIDEAASVEVPTLWARMKDTLEEQMQHVDIARKSGHTPRIKVEEALQVAHINIFRRFDIEATTATVKAELPPVDLAPNPTPA